LTASLLTAIIWLQVKPQYLDGVLEALKPHVTPDHLVISICAGVRIASLERSLPQGARVVRVMPNTPCLVGEAASAYVLGSHATASDGEKAFTLLSSIGQCLAWSHLSGKHRMPLSSRCTLISAFALSSLGGAGVAEEG
jgi:pyrroline-5-carboxylate reductase